MKLRRLSRQPLTGLFLAAAAGIIAAEYHPFPLAIPLCLQAALAGFLAWRRSTAALLIFTGCVFFLLHDLCVRDDPGKKLSREFSENTLPVTAAGVVVSEPVEKQTTGKIPICTFRLSLESIAINGRGTIPCDATVMVGWRGNAPTYGDRLFITGDARNIPGPRNPGEFDYAGWLNRLEIYSQIRMRYPADGKILESNRGNSVIAMALKTRRWMQEKLRLDLENSPEVSGLMQGIVLGLRTEIPDEIEEAFQATGTMHLFVVNGLHIGMFTTIAFLFIRLTGAGRRLSVLIVLPLIIFYALLTGLGAGSLRASIMAVVLLSGQLFDRKPLSLNSLAFAGLVILAWNTNELFMTGFQFSFGVVFSIIMFAGRFHRFCMKFGTPDSFLPRVLWSKFQKSVYFCWGHVSQLLGVSLAASIGSLPFSTAYFNLLTPSAVVANLFIVPIAFLILAQGLLAILSATFSTFIAILFNNTNWLLAHLAIRTASLFAQLPGGHLFVELPNFKTKPSCEITVLDLQGGGAIHLRGEKHEWLIDCGNTMNWQGIVQPYLRTRGIDRLDGFLLTRGNVAFAGAAPLVEKSFKPRLTGESFLEDRSRSRRDFHQWLTDHHVTPVEYQQGNAIAVSGSVKIRVLYPPPDLDVRLADDKCLVLRLECNRHSVLFMSGSGFLTEHWLLENEKELRSDILVKNQHGSDASGTPDFIAAVAPQVIVCSSGNIPISAHIDQEWADEIVARGIQLFRQDQTGSVHIDLNREDFTVTSFLGNQIFRSKSR